MKRKYQKYINIGRLIENKDEERQDLLTDYKTNIYIFFLSPKVLNCLLDLSKKINNLTYLVSIKSEKYQKNTYKVFKSF